MKEKGAPCIFVGYFTTSKGYIFYNKRIRLIVESIHINFHELKEVMASVHNSPRPTTQRQMTFEHNSLELEIEDHSNKPSSSKLVPNVSSLAEISDSSLQDLEFLFNIQPILEPIIPPTNAQAEENNTGQAADAQFEAYEFINPFCTPVQEVAESSSRNIDTSNMHTFYQRQRPEMCMFTLTESTAEPKNIREAMDDHAWIKAMHEELLQFHKPNVWELVDKPFGKMVINLKWLWKNKKD
ncbi:retrovirus-related pol polyprotein from transposon TNT 1-94, partial [Tanacetum coccineum]